LTNSFPRLPGGAQPVSTNAPPVITPEMMQEALRVFIRESKTIQREARAGNPRQQHNLAVLYTLGIGVPLDFKRAHHWFNKAALQGLPESQFNLAIAYQGGMGVRKDMVIAYKFYSLAATQGLPYASKGRDHIAQYMSRIQIETAQRMARGFQQGITRWAEMKGFEKAGQSNVNRILGLLPDPNDSGGGNDGD
jgi:TPR repeat protein